MSKNGLCNFWAVPLKGKEGTHVPFFSFLLFIAECKDCGKSSLTLWTRAIPLGWQSQKMEGACVLKTTEPPLRPGPPSRML